MTSPTPGSPDSWPLLNPAPAQSAVEEQHLAAFMKQRLPPGRQHQGLLQALVRIQFHFGWIPPAAIRLLGSRYRASAEAIRGLIDFYHFLHHRFQGEYRILLSNCVLDRFAGQDRIRDILTGRLGIPSTGMREDGRVSLGETSCTGLCEQGPAALVNGYPVTRLSPGRAVRMAALIEARRPLDQWPAHWFRVDTSIRRAGPLLNAPFSPGQVLAATAGQCSEDLLEQVRVSGLRGRGGAGYSFHHKLVQVAGQPPGLRYLVCNADEGEPGTFKDRVLLQTRSEAVIEGMTLAARILGAAQGFIYLRGEYAFLYQALQRRLARRRVRGWLGRNIAGIDGFDFDIEVQLGAGAYVCGEESALIESLEGKRGVPRIRPPYPVSQGYRGYPTLVNNVETFACLPQILLHGGEAFSRRGTPTASGTKLHSVCGDCTQPGIYELPWGGTLQELLQQCGGSDAQAVQVGGPSGTLVFPEGFQRRLDYGDLGTGGALMVFGPKRDLLTVIDDFAAFFAHESCGFCTPCRAGTRQLRLLTSRLREGRSRKTERENFARLHLLMTHASHCGLGKTATAALHQFLLHRDELPGGQVTGRDRAGFDLDAALTPARGLTEGYDND